MAALILIDPTSNCLPSPTLPATVKVRGERERERARCARNNAIVVFVGKAKWGLTLG